MIIVPDASVILKWILEKSSEPDQVQARWLARGDTNRLGKDQIADSLAF